MSLGFQKFCYEILFQKIQDNLFWKGSEIFNPKITRKWLFWKYEKVQEEIVGVPEVKAESGHEF